MDYLHIFLKLLFGFISLLIIMRVLGKKELSQVTPFDIIYSVVFGGILEESIYDPKVTIMQLLFAVVSWGLIIYAVEYITYRSQWIRTSLKGKPAYLIQDGLINMKEMKRHNMEMEQLRSLMRMQNIFSMSEIKYMILEPGGQVSIQKYNEYESVSKKDISAPLNDPTINYMIIDEGKISKETLTLLEKTEAWVYKMIEKKGYKNPKDIVYAEWSESDGVFIQPYKDIETIEID